MSIQNKYLIGIFITALALSFGFNSAYAQKTVLTPDQASSIIANCTPIKNRLDQLHVNDALLRVNRGQLYETVYSKLILQFNKRAQSNNYDISMLQMTTEKFSAQLENFRKDYRAYEQQLDETIKQGCSNGAQSFVDNIDTAREYRNKVYEDIKQLNSTLDEYSTNFMNIKSIILGKQ